MKYCYKCKETKPESEFYKNKRMKDGLANECKVCCVEACKKYRAKNREKMLIKQRAKRYIRLYGITLEQKMQILKEQSGLCAICSKPIEGINACIDHDHETGRVRGVLCRLCNIGIGALGDSVSGLRKAIKYMENM